MSLKDDIALFLGLSIFEGLTEEHLRLLAFGAERRRLEAGQVLFRQGSSADSAFVIASGRMELTMKYPSDPERSIAEVGPGTILTEIAMITETERHFTATAVEPSEVIRISRALFRRMLEEFPEVAVAIDKRLRENFSRLAASASTAGTRFG